MELNLTPFSGLITQCFEPYLDIYIETQNQNLSELVERAAKVNRLERKASGLLPSPPKVYLAANGCVDNI